MIFYIIKMLKENKEDKEKVKTYLESKTESLIYILIRCYAIGNLKKCYKAWKNDIYTILNRMVETNKPITYKKLYRWDIERWSDSLYDHLRGYISEVKYKDKIDTADIDRSELSDFILDYFNWLYKRFEKYGFATEVEINIEIDMLMKKYNRSYLL